MNVIKIYLEFKGINLSTSQILTVKTKEVVLQYTSKKLSYLL